MVIRRAGPTHSNCRTLATLLPTSPSTHSNCRTLATAARWHVRHHGLLWIQGLLIMAAIRGRNRIAVCRDVTQPLLVVSCQRLPFSTTFCLSLTQTRHKNNGVDSREVLWSYTDVPPAMRMYQRGSGVIIPHLGGTTLGGYQMDVEGRWIYMQEGEIWQLDRLV